MYIFLKCFENNVKLEILINELGRLFQYFTPIFVKRNRFLEVLETFSLSNKFITIIFIFNKSDLQINR